MRNLAYSIVEKNNLKNIFNKEIKQAGKKWYYGFMARHPKLSLRQPESISISRAKGFNRENVNEFFDLLEAVVDQNKFDATSIYNMDKSGFSTVQKKNSKVISEKGKHQVGAISSGERGVNTTFVCCCSAAGSFVPPMIIFKRIRFHAALAKDKPAGSLIEVSESGYINTELFIKWLQHFIETVKPTPNKKVLLLLDGHTTHSKNLKAINLARENGVIMLQLPGHTTHRLQPLDVAIFGPMETYYGQAIQQWLRSNPGKKVSQFEVAKLLNTAYSKAASIENAAQGFKATGCWEVNRHVFKESDFVASNNLNSIEKSSDEENEEDIDDPDPVAGQNENDLNLMNLDGTPATPSISPLMELRRKSATPSTSPLMEPQPSTSMSTSPSQLQVPVKEISPVPVPKGRTKTRFQKGAQKAIVITTSPYKEDLEIKQKKRLEKEARKEEREKKKQEKEAEGVIVTKKAPNQKKRKTETTKCLTQKKENRRQRRKQNQKKKKSSYYSKRRRNTFYKYKHWKRRRMVLHIV